MEMDMEGDVASLNPDFLELPELPPLPPLSYNRFLVEKLFSLWLSLPETVSLVNSFLDDPDEISTVISVSTKKYLELKEQCLAAIGVHFYGRTGLRIDEFKVVTKDLCGLPSFFSKALYRKIDVNNTGLVTRDQFVDYWIGGKMLSKDLATQIYTVLKQPDCAYLTKDDFCPFLNELGESHPGLEFIKKQTINRHAYADTVLCIIFYYINRTSTGHLTLRELKCGNLISAMQHLDEEKDINKVLKYFSYEHFYVIWFKFCELDTDNDFQIVKEDILRYGGACSLSNRIVDRIFDQVPRIFNCEIQGKMDYFDFVSFILPEEDKSSEPAVEYWFKCLDLDGNGVLTPNELEHFYDEQLQRMEHKGEEKIPFHVVMVKIIDMVKPKNDSFITLTDLKGCQLSGHVFNTLFNLGKSIAYEFCDPIDFSRRLQYPTWTEWEHFAHWEYIRLSRERDLPGSRWLKLVRYGPNTA